MSTVVVSRPRQGGKTYELLQWMRENPDGVMVCISVAELQRVRKQNPDIDPYRFVTVDMARDGLAGSHVHLAVDNLDILLSSTLRNPVSVVSFNGIEVR